MAANDHRKVTRYDLVSPMRPCKDEIMAAFERFLMSGQYILGEEVKMLEKEMAEACGVPDAVGVSSGSSALYLALAVADVGPGCEVITTPYTFVATIEAIIRLGAKPVFVDISHEDLNMDPSKIEAAITERTKAIVPVHIFGVPCEMHEICRIADRNHLEVIVDMAQAFGTLYDGKPCGSYGRMSSLSFYPTKNLPAIGDGGLILCQQAEDAERLRLLRGHDPMYLGGKVYPGFNYRLDEVQAMVVRIRLARFKEEQQDRDRVAKIYNQYIPAANRLVDPNGGRGIYVTHHQYWIRTRHRDALQKVLAEANVDTAVYYDPALNHHPLAEYCREADALVEAERAGDEILILPIHSSLPFEDAERIGMIVRDFLAEHEGE